MAIEGPLRELALSDVFQLLHLSRKTGTLMVRSETRDHPAMVRFDRGAIVGADYSGSAGRIGHLLLRAGKIRESDLERAQREQELRPDRPLGALLVEMGISTEAEVERQLRFQIEETVYELIRWTEGYFRFEEAPPLEDGTISVRIPTESLLMEAVRRIDEWTTLEPKVPHMGVVPVLVGEDPSGAPLLDLHPAEWEVLSEIDGERSLKAIAKELGRGDFDVAKIVYGLVSTGVVEITHRRPSASTQTHRPAAAGLPGADEVDEALRSRDLEKAARLLRQLLRRHPQRAEVHLLLGRLHSARAERDEAVQAFSEATRLDPLLAPAHYHLGFAAARVGDLRGAETAWHTYVRLDDAETDLQETVFRAARAASTLRHLLDQEGE